MSEDLPTTQQPAPAPVGSVRRRQPKQDPVLAQAVDVARVAVLDAAQDETNVGEYRGAEVHEDRLLTHRFACTMPGYPGWDWFATVARAPRTKYVTVCEVGLLAGEDSLLAPEWVPWEERMQAVMEQQEDAASDVAPENSEDGDPRDGDPGDEDSSGDGAVETAAETRPEDDTQDPAPTPDTLHGEES